jgi:hypothetical protein
MARITRIAPLGLVNIQLRELRIHHEEHEENEEGRRAGIVPSVLRLRGSVGSIVFTVIFTLISLSYGWPGQLPTQRARRRIDGAAPYPRTRIADS